MINPLDGGCDFIAVDAGARHDLRIAVTRDAAVALQPWRDETDPGRHSYADRRGLGRADAAAARAPTRARRVGEQALRESEERYALAMEGANEGHWDWDIVADRLFLSPRMKVLRWPERG